MLAIKSLMRARPRGRSGLRRGDQGIGGAVGEEVGKMLRAIASLRQVLCITASALIAAHGTRHFVVAKATGAGAPPRGPPAGREEREDESSRAPAGRA